MIAYEDLVNMIRGSAVDHHTINPSLYIIRPDPNTQSQQHATGLIDRPIKNAPKPERPIYKPNPPPTKKIFKKPLLYR
jgi:hypothetical protein